jgi:hypothetical protein
MTGIERSDKEIAEAEAMLRAGHRAVDWLVQQLMDWAIERKLLSNSGTVQVPGGKLGNRMEATWA